MIQRKQTLFLLLALLCTVACLCLPIGYFTPKGMGADISMYNLWVVEPNGGHNYSVWGLFAILLITIPINVVAIMSYKNRKSQARFCLFNALLCLGWCVVYGVFSQVLTTYGKFHPQFVAVLPLVSLILYLMARKAILADEALVRAADRIR